MFDAPLPLLYQLRKNLNAWSSLSFFFFTLEIFGKPGLIPCSLIPTPVTYSVTLSVLKECMRQDTN